MKLTVRRDVLLEDAYRALGRAGQAIKGRLMVRQYTITDCGWHTTGALHSTAAGLLVQGDGQ